MSLDGDRHLAQCLHRLSSCIGMEAALLCAVWNSVYFSLYHNYGIAESSSEDSPTETHSTVYGRIFYQNNIYTERSDYSTLRPEHDSRVKYCR